MAQNKTVKGLEHSASEKSGFFSVRGQSHSGSVSQKPEDYQSVSSKDVSSVMRRWDIETPITDPLCDSQCVSSPITDMCSVCAAKGIGKIASHICRDCSQHGRYYCQSCWDYHNKFLPTHDTLSLSVSSESNQGWSVKSIKAASNCNDEIKMWLNELKQQIEKDEYNEKAFDHKPNGNSESAKLSVILKEICTIIQRRSKRQSKKEKKEDKRKFKTKTQEQTIKDIWTIIHKDKNTSGKVDIENYLDEIKQHVFVTQDNLDEIETEVNSLLEEIYGWDDTKPVNKPNKNQCKVVKALHESRSKLRERKLDFKRGRDKVGIAQTEKQRQDQVVKEMWRMISPSSGKANSDVNEIGTALIEIRQYVLHAKIRLAEFYNIETEVYSLLEEINGWDVTKPLNKANKNRCKVMIALRESRLRLRERVLEFKRRKQMFNEMQSMLEKSTKSLTLSYSGLLDEPYLFLEPITNADSIRRKVPDWLQGHAALIDRICAGIRENKEKFLQTCYSL